jgi:hypothetical protein
MKDLPDTVTALDPARALVLEAFIVTIESKLQQASEPIPGQTGRIILNSYVSADLATVRTHESGTRTLTMLRVTASITAGADLNLLRTWVSMAKDTLAAARCAP